MKTYHMTADGWGSIGPWVISAASAEEALNKVGHALRWVMYSDQAQNAPARSAVIRITARLCNPAGEAIEGGEYATDRFFFGPPAPGGGAFQRACDPCGQKPL